MSALSGADLLELLRGSQLLDGGQLDEVARDHSVAADARALARDLAHRGWLTPYQANRLVLGQGAELVLGPYRLLEPLGAGPTGRVFKARDTRMNRVVALKIIHPEHLASAAWVKLFDRAASSATALVHPHIVRVHGSGQVGGTHVLVSEHVEGDDLETRVQKAGPLAVTEACAFIRQACWGLQYALRHQVVHGNLKPRNLLVTAPRPGEPALLKIADFGSVPLAAKVSPRRSLFAQVGEVVGTIDFIAPEQAGSPPVTDTRSDIFGLGCCLYYFLTARLPFPGTSVIDRVLARSRREPPAVRSLRFEVPPGLEAVLAKMLARDPAGRFQAPEQVVDALESFARLKAPAVPVPALPGEPRGQIRVARPAGAAVPPLPRKPPTPAVLPVPQASLPRWTVPACVGLVVLLASAIGSSLWFSQHTKKPGQTQPTLARATDVSPRRVIPAVRPARNSETTPESTRPDKEPKHNPEKEPPPEPKEPAPTPKAEPRPAPIEKSKPEPKPKSPAEPEAKPEKEPKPEPKPQEEPKPKPKPAPVVSDKRLPLPTPAAQKKAEELIRELFKPEYTRRGPADMKALSAKLYQQALDTKDDQAARYVLLREAQDLAAQAGDLETAFRAVAQTAKEYAADALLLKHAALTTAGRTARTMAGNQAVAEAALPLVDEAVAADRYDVALRLVSLADSACRRCSSVALGRRIQVREEEVRAAEKEYKRVKPLIAALADGGAGLTDPADYLAAGKYLCFLKGAWDRGLPLLARGGDADLKALAEKDLAKPTEAGAQVQLGDEWWDLAEAEDGLVKKQLRRRAGHWYRQPAAKLQGLTRTKVERRLKLVRD